MMPEMAQVVAKLREEFAGLRKGLGFWVKKRTKQRVAVPFSKAIAKGCIPEIEGMQPFSVYVLIFNELRSP